MSIEDAAYLGIVLEPIRKCAEYEPKFGKGAKAGLSLKDFQELYGSDRFYSWFGLDNPLLYAAHKAAGGMTSIYRQIGIGCERLFQRILQDSLGLSQEASTWSYEVLVSGGRKRRLSLDGRILLSAIPDETVRSRVSDWIGQAAGSLGVDPGIIQSLTGTVFEVRQGYKSKDSKRQNADIANAASAYTASYLPCAMVFSSQIDDDIANRYRAEKWLLLTGAPGNEDPMRSTYSFMRSVVGYDLGGSLKGTATFFARRSTGFSMHCWRPNEQARAERQATGGLYAQVQPEFGSARMATTDTRLLGEDRRRDSG